MAASDSEIDENTIRDVEADLLESVYVHLTEGKYQEGVSANQKRVIQKKAANFRIVNGEMIFKEKCRGKEEVYIHYSLATCHANNYIASCSYHTCMK